LVGLWVGLQAQFLADLSGFSLERPQKKDRSKFLIPSIPVISAGLGLALVIVSLAILWRGKINYGFGDLLSVAAYSFVAASAFGVFLSSTWYVFTGQVFPGQTTQELTLTIEIGAVIILLGGLYAYYRNIKSHFARERTTGRS